MPDFSTLSRRQKTLNVLCCSKCYQRSGIKLRQVHIILRLLDSWLIIRKQMVELGRRLVLYAQKNQAGRILMSIPGIGAITATSFAAAIEDPETSENHGLWALG